MVFMIILNWWVHAESQGTAALKKKTETMCERPSVLYIQLFWVAAAAAPHSTSSNKGILKGNRFSMRTFAPLAVDEGGVPFQEKKRQSSNRLKTK